MLLIKEGEYTNKAVSCKFEATVFTLMKKVSNCRSRNSYSIPAAYLIAILLKRLDKVLCNYLRRSAFYLVAFDKMYQLTILKQSYRW